MNTILPVASQVAAVLFDRANCLGELGRGEEAIAAYDEMVRRFGDDEDPSLRPSLGIARNSKRAGQPLVGPWASR